MSTYIVRYKWQQRDYFTTMQHVNAAKAVMAAEMQIMQGAKVYAVEVAA